MKPLRPLVSPRNSLKEAVRGNACTDRFAEDPGGPVLATGRSTLDGLGASSFHIHRACDAGHPCWPVAGGFTVSEPDGRTSSAQRELGKDVEQRRLCLETDAR